MKIGSILLENPLILAPLAGITHLPFRVLAKEAGCALVTSEMISSNGLHHGSEETREMLAMKDSERPIAVQLFGQHPEIMADAAARVEALGADIIDVNFGCAVRKVVKTGAGAALMRDAERSRAILSGMRKAVKIPLTIKMRTGWDGSGKEAMVLLRIAQDCGVDALTIHPRTAGQRFRGCADWSMIKRVKQEAAIPVIGNGDIRQPHDVLHMMAETGCDAVMIGRAAIGNPWFFEKAQAALQKRPISEVPPEIRLSVMRSYSGDLIALFGEYRACRMLRSRLGWFSKGLPASTHFRHRISRVRTREEIFSLIGDYEEALQKQGGL
jgi:nifR3 family TIM-barrel protein